MSRVAFLTPLGKSRPLGSDGDRRLICVEPSTEGVDLSNERVVREALDAASRFFLARGNVDLDHLSKSSPASAGAKAIAERYRAMGFPIPTAADGSLLPHPFEIGKPLEYRVENGRPRVVFECYQGPDEVVGVANFYWRTLTEVSPPWDWFSSIGGFYLKKSVAVGPNADPLLGGGKRIEKFVDVTQLIWNNLAQTRHAVNHLVDRAALAKSLEVEIVDLPVLAKSLTETRLLAQYNPVHLFPWEQWAAQELFESYKRLLDLELEPAQAAEALRMTKGGTPHDALAGFVTLLMLEGLEVPDTPWDGVRLSELGDHVAARIRDLASALSDATALKTLAYGPAGTDQAAFTQGAALTASGVASRGPVKGGAVGRAIQNLLDRMGSGHSKWTRRGARFEGVEDLIGYFKEVEQLSDDDAEAAARELLSRLKRRHSASGGPQDRR